MHPAFARTDHRPWPLPQRPWRWRQSWCDLLFAHWPVAAAELRRLVPRPLTIQEFEGTSWVGVVPFRMEGVMHRPFPDLPYVSAFPELNLRLYVERDGCPGVWFLSLDATNPLAVWAARKFFYLPYFNAQMCLEERHGAFEYRCVRKRDTRARFHATYRPVSDPYESSPGSLEHWLTERYCLYASAPNGTLWRAEVHHLPWPLQRAEASISVNEIATPHGLALDSTPTLLHFAKRLNVVVWPLEPVAVQCRPESKPLPIMKLAPRPA